MPARVIPMRRARRVAVVPGRRVRITVIYLLGCGHLADACCSGSQGYNYCVAYGHANCCSGDNCCSTCANCGGTCDPSCDYNTCAPYPSVAPTPMPTTYAPTVTPTTPSPTLSPTVADVGQCCNKKALCEVGRPAGFDCSSCTCPADCGGGSIWFGKRCDERFPVQMNLIVAWSVLGTTLLLTGIALYFGLLAFPAAALRERLVRAVLEESRHIEQRVYDQAKLTTSELQALPPELALLPSEEEARASAASSCREQACMLLLYFPFRFLGGFAQAFSTICLILRSFRQNEHVARLMANQLDAIFAATRFLGPVSRAIEAVVRWFYDALDLTHIIEKLVVDLDVTCRGAQQPWFLLANLTILCSVVVLTSADVLDPLCFRLVWRSLIVEREYHFSRSAVALRRIEAMLLFAIQTLFTLVSSRPLRVTHSTECKDISVSSMVFVAALLYAIPVMLVILAAFLRGDGPAPPDAGIDRLDERLRGRRFANETDRVHMHIKLSADGMTRRAWLHGGLRYFLRLQAWRVRCLTKISLGYWDRDALIATAIARRADCFVSHRLPTLPPGEHAIGLQLHQDLMSATSKIASTLWMLLPCGIVLTKISEALNTPPWHTPQDLIDADSTSRWKADLKTLEPIPNENKSMLIFNESEWVRRRRRSLQATYVAALFLFVLFPTPNTFAALLIVLAVRDAIDLAFDAEEQVYWRRHVEWRHRVSQVQFRRTFVDWAEPRPDGQQTPRNVEIELTEEGHARIQEGADTSEAPAKEDASVSAEEAIVVEDARMDQPIYFNPATGETLATRPASATSEVGPDSDT